MIPGGYILQPRTFDDSDASHFPPVTRELWFYLLRNVNHARSDKLNIERGQGFFRFEDIQNALAWYAGYRKNTYSKPQLTKSLRRLREGNMVETAKETRGLLITICNYDYYQDPTKYEGNGEKTTKELRKVSAGRTINKKNKEQEEVKKKDFLPDSNEIRLSNLLLTKIKERNPEHKEPDIQGWAKDIDKMIRLDNRDPQKIANLIVWVQKDSFEQNVVLSTSSLRRRFDALYLKMTAKPKTSAGDDRADSIAERLQQEAQQKAANS